jgi:hypothetical protein
LDDREAATGRQYAVDLGSEYIHEGISVLRREIFEFLDAFARKAVSRQIYSTAIGAHNWHLDDEPNLTLFKHFFQFTELSEDDI